MAKDFEEIRADVVKAGGVQAVKMQVLRDASPYNRLGPGVNTEISESLRQKTLSHTPNPLPLGASETVYVYENGSQAGRLIEAITGGSPSDDGAKTILEAVRANDAENGVESKLEEVRALAVQLNDILGDDEAAALAAA